MGKPPAFLFYPNNWLGSPDIMLMTPSEEGAYIRLLAISWNNEDCSLPDDDKQLSQLSRLGEGWFAGASQVVRRCFVSKDGRLYNKRLLLERKKQEEWREKSRLGGETSWQVRKKTGKMTRKGWAKGGSQMVQTKAEPTAEPKPNIEKESIISKLTGSNGKYPQEWYEQLRKEYVNITGRKPVGSGWGKINATFKQLFEDGNTVTDITGCMKQCQKKYTDWYMPALINHMHEYKAGGKSSALDTLKAEAMKTRKEVNNDEAKF